MLNKGPYFFWGSPNIWKRSNFFFNLPIKKNIFLYIAYLNFFFFNWGPQIFYVKLLENLGPQIVIEGKGPLFFVLRAPY